MKKPSCMKTFITALTLYVTSFTYANNMQSSFNDAMNFGKAQNGQASNAITSFDPSKISDNFTSNPSEVNLKGSASNLNSIGLSEFHRSEVGKTINTSTVNNPKVKISEDADFLKGADDIRQNASVISGMKSGKQCVKQVLSKSSITNHFCEKDNAVSGVCKRTQDVVWSGKKELKEEWVSAGNEFNRRRDGNIFQTSFHVPVSEILGYEILIKRKKGYNFSFNSSMTLLFRGLGKEHEIVEIKRKYTTPTELYHKNESYQNTLKKGETITLYFVGGIWGFVQADYDITLKFKVKKEVDTLKAELQDNISCSFPMTNADEVVKVREQCTQAGGDRDFVRDGKKFTLNSDCWEKTETYLINDASDNECKTYESNPNCSVAERECVLDVGGNCTRFRNKYQCSVTTKTDGYLCGDEFFCSDGSCADLEGTVNTNFGHAVSQLANLAKATEDYDYENQKFTAFTGRAMYCRKSGFGYSDCCKDSGWGNKAGLAQCNDEEQMLGQAKEKKTAVFVGTFCSRKVLGKCIQRKSSYCVFDNKLARITQVQGRSGQLGIGFGGAKNPDCRGLTVDELSSIDFNNMDYTDFYEELNSNTEVPDKDRLIDYMKNSISEQMQQK